MNHNVESTTDKPVGIFLSHTSADNEFVQRLASDLASAGAKVWVDEAELDIGDSLIDKISTGINDMDYLAVVLSIASVSSEWVRREVEVALNREIKNKKIIVLPLLYQKCSIPSFLVGKVYADFTEPGNYSSSLFLLLRRLGLGIGERNETYRHEFIVKVSNEQIRDWKLALMSRFCDESLEATVLEWHQIIRDPLLVLQPVLCRSIDKRESDSTMSEVLNIAPVYILNFFMTQDSIVVFKGIVSLSKGTKISRNSVIEVRFEDILQVNIEPRKTTNDNIIVTIGSSGIELDSALKPQGKTYVDCLVFSLINNINYVFPIEGAGICLISQGKHFSDEAELIDSWMKSIRAMIREKKN